MQVHIIKSYNSTVNRKTNNVSSDPTKSDKPKQNNAFVTGLVAGFVGAFAVYPIDVVKTRMQNQTATNPLYSNGFDCCRQLWKQGGIKPFYRGCVPQMIGVGPEKAIKLLAYTIVTKSNPNELSTHIMGGLTAGACQVIVTSPYELIKINLQM